MILARGVTHGYEQRTRLQVDGRQGLAQLREVRSAHAHEQFVILARERTARFDERLQNGDDLRRRSIVQVEHFELLCRGHGAHEQQAYRCQAAPGQQWNRGSQGLHALILATFADDFRCVRDARRPTVQVIAEMRLHT